VNDSMKYELRHKKILYIDKMFEVSEDIMTFESDDEDMEIEMPRIK